MSLVCSTHVFRNNRTVLNVSYRQYIVKEYLTIHISYGGTCIAILWQEYAYESTFDRCHSGIKRSWTGRFKPDKRTITGRLSSFHHALLSKGGILFTCFCRTQHMDDYCSWITVFAVSLLDIFSRKESELSPQPPSAAWDLVHSSAFNFLSHTEALDSNTIAHQGSKACHFRLWICRNDGPRRDEWRCVGCEAQVNA